MREVVIVRLTIVSIMIPQSHERPQLYRGPIDSLRTPDFAGYGGGAQTDVLKWNYMPKDVSGQRCHI